MGLGSNLLAAANCRPDNDNQLTIPVSIASEWMTVVDATGADGADNATITDPDVQINNSTTHKVEVQGRGTTVLIRGKRAVGDSGITANVVQVFGKDLNGLWMRLLDASGNHKLTLSIDGTNDVRTTTFAWTESVEVDMQGCTEILVGVSIAYAATGDATVATIEAKIK